MRVLVLLCGLFALGLMATPQVFAQKAEVATATGIQTVVRGKTTRFLVDLTKETVSSHPSLPSPTV